MADWYVSSAAWALIAQFAASTAYTVGQIVRPLTTPAATAQCAFRCTTAGTSGAEPSWPQSNNATVTTGGATFTNVTAQSTYGWAACAGGVNTMINSGISDRILAGDRCFVSSDHSESNGSVTWELNNSSGGFGVTLFVSVNRAPNNIPPATADQLSGASLTFTGALTIEAYCNGYWQGFTFVMSSGGNLLFNSSARMNHYYRNCVFNITGSGTTTRLGSNNPSGVTFDNTTVEFSNVGQGFGTGGSYPTDFHWVNTPSAFVAGTQVTALFESSNNGGVWTATLRGVDISAFTGALLSSAGGAFTKLLLDSCKVSTSMTRTVAATTSTEVQDEIELVNCYDGTHIFSERHNAWGDAYTSTSVYLTGGAQDNVGNYSLEMITNGKSDDFIGMLDSFWFDVDNTLVGSARTATIEIMSNISLNYSDLQMVLQYEGTSGSSLAENAYTFPNALAAAGAITASAASWTGSPVTTWSPTDESAATLSSGNLTVTWSGTGGARGLAGMVSGGKYYFEITCTNWSSVSPGIGLISASFTSGTTGMALCLRTSGIYVNGSATVYSLGILSSGTILGIAVDLVNNLIWFRAAPSGNWNGNSSANPATATDGASISAIVTGPLYPILTSGTSSDTVTANFGASAFSGAVPSGFQSGLDAAVTQHLQATFTPEQAGRLRAQLKLGKPTSLVYVNPQITVT